MKIAVIFSNGTEELEALTPVDVLRRAGVLCDIVSISGKTPSGSHGIVVLADKIIEDVDLSQYDGIIIPGGMPGATNISKNQKVIIDIKNKLSEGKLVAAICASPAVVLAGNNLIKDKRVTCYPAKDFIEMLKSCVFVEEAVVVQDNLITANGPKSALDFSLRICDFLGVKAKF